MIDRGAQHKVYAHTNTLQLQAPHICRAHAARHFCGERRPQHADLGARADRVEERRGSRRRYRIDHGEAPLRRRLAQDEPAQGPGGPCRAPPLCRLPPSFELSAALQLERLLRSDSDLDSGVATMCAVATVKVRVRSDFGAPTTAVSAVGAVPRLVIGDRETRRAERSFYCTP